MKKIFSIAIDGPSGAGKSTVARLIASKLNAMYLDTGAMYRTVGLYMLRNGIPMDEPAEIAANMSGVNMSVRFISGEQRVFLGCEDVSEAIRTAEVSMAASAVGTVREVRNYLVDLQRRIAEGESVVMDGRDIGTAVLPKATVKIFLTASPEVRAKRRCEELAGKGMNEPYDKVLSELIERDYQDSHRTESPLMVADDAFVVDNSNMNQQETMEAICKLVYERIGG